jgi:hypothetical protein
MSNSRFGNRTRTGNVQDWMVPLNFNFDTDALAFINATGISNPIQKVAINFLTLGLKENNIWTPLKAIYPVVGGTSHSHKFNLKNPADTDAAFRLSFSAGWTHSDTGMTPNGTSAWADTFLVPSTQLVLGDISFSTYSRTNSEENTSDMGTAAVDPTYYQRQTIRTRRATNQMIGILSDAGLQDVYAYTNTNSQGYYIFTNDAATTKKMFKNGTLLTPTGTSDLGGGGLSTVSFAIGAENFQNFGPSAFNTRQNAFATIGEALTDQEAISLNAIVSTYQRI